MGINVDFSVKLENRVKWSARYQVLSQTTQQSNFWVSQLRCGLSLGSAYVTETRMFSCMPSVCRSNTNTTSVHI